MLKKAIVLLLGLCLQLDGNSQTSCTATLSGRVTDATGAPLFGVAITLTPGNTGTITDEEGRYGFHNLCAGPYTVNVDFIGYKKVSVKLNVSGNVTKNFSLEEAITLLEEVVIHHHDAAHTEHATNYVQLDERKLAERAGKSLGETLMEIPGVNSLQTGPGIFKPVIHGLHSQRLLILNHGIRQEGQQWGAEHAPEIDPFIASNIVVIKDASAIKYGTDALGGVIVVNPAPLPEKHQLAGTLTSVLQSNGRSGTLSGMLEGGLKQRDGWGWRVQGTAKRSGDFQTPDYVLSNTGISEFNFSASTGYHNEQGGVDLFFSRFQSENGILRGTAIGSLEDLVNAMERSEPLYTTSFSYQIHEPRQEVSHNLLKLNGHINGRAGEWRFQYGFQNNNRREFDARIGDLSQIPAIDLQLNSHSADVEWETHHSEKRTFSFGTNVLLQGNRNIPGTQRIPFIPNFTNTSAGIFATGRFFLPKWIIGTGVRFDYRAYSVKGFDYLNSPYDADLAFNNVSASLGITRELTHQQTLNLNVSTSWRPPHVSELYSLGTHQSAAAIEYGLMLDPVSNEIRDVNEVSLSSEQAVKAVATYELTSDRIHFHVSPYANYILNFIHLRPHGITKNIRGVYPYFRYGQTDALFIGVDAAAEAKLEKHLTASPRISLLKARDVGNDDYFLFIPSNRFSLDLRYERPEVLNVKNAYVESGFHYIARQFFSPRIVTVREIQEAEDNGTDPFHGDDAMFDFAEAPSGYHLLDVALGFSLKGEKAQYDFRLSVENMLNQRYRDYTNRFRYYADEPGRNVVLSVKCIF